MTMFTQTEALVIIKFIKEQREQALKTVPDAGPAQLAYFTLVRISVLLSYDAEMTVKEVEDEILPQPTELIL